MKGVVGLRGALALVWRSDPVGLVVVMGAEALGTLALLVELLAGRRLLGALTGTGTGAEVRSLLPLLVVIGFAVAVRAVAGTASRELRIRLTERLRRSVVSQVTTIAAMAPYEHTESSDFHDRLQRARSALDQRAWSAIWGVVSLAQAGFAVAAACIVVLSVSPTLVPLALIGVLPLSLASARNARALYDLSYEYTSADREREYLESLMLGRDAAKEVRSFGLQPVLGSRLDGLWSAHLRRIDRVVRGRIHRAVLSSSVASALLFVALLVVVGLVSSGRVDLAGAAVAVVALRQAASSVRTAADNAGSLFEAVLFFDDFSVFAAQIEPREEHGSGVPASAVAFRDVSFTYPGAIRPALDNIELDLRPGRIVALVGANGSGKTTLVKLVCGLYEPTAGRVERDGDVSVAALFQDFVRYELSARDNITFGAPALADDTGRMRRSAEASDVAGIVERLDDGYDTRLSRAFGGTDLSIGQWQRVALARALFSDAPVLVLDEPTAALDSIAEAELFERLRVLAAERAVLLVSHRFSSVRGADHIVVLDHGRILEEGSHDQLMAARGRYHHLFSRQAAAYQ
ncbi:MAG: ABC transporter ATP-binding protein/permease [Acidimicrobiia bacterium]|nr:ABC transporter ATP-binding protein/permease [Acidimicrobiia bacterium]